MPVPLLAPQSFQSLHDYATAEGIPIVRADIPEYGRWLPESKAIVLRHDLTSRAEVSLLAHELGHYHFGHDCSSERWEAQAWRFAAETLISEEAYIDAAIVSTHIKDLAENLGVLVDVVRAYQQVRFLRSYS